MVFSVMAGSSGLGPQDNAFATSRSVAINGGFASQDGSKKFSIQQNNKTQPKALAKVFVERLDCPSTNKKANHWRKRR
jgi:hypothetical protein